jgi:Flp pilus assembly protein TadD
MHKTTATNEAKCNGSTLSAESNAEAIPPLAREAIEHARRRNFDMALSTGKKALEQHASEMGLQLFVGLLHTRRMEFDEALPHLRAAVDLAPTDAAATLELARAFMAVGRFDEAELLLSKGRLPKRESQMLRAAISSRRGNLAEAIAAFQALVEADPNDFESWANLGVALLNARNAPAAADALGRSLHLRPDRPRVLDKWAEAHVAAGTGEQALAEILSARKQQGNDTFLAVAAARLHDLLGRPERALDELELSLQVDPDNSAALTVLADLHERQNRLESFAATVERLESVAPQSELLPFLQATLAFRQGRLEEGLNFAQSASPVTDPGSRASLIGKIYDRLGRSEDAWDAYTTMNREDARAVTGASAEAKEYRRQLESQLNELTAEWASNWTCAEEPESQPAFLVGFPRSGTTLLDTFLMGHPTVCISEENPLLQTVSDAAGDLKRLPRMPESEVDRLRALYFQEASKYVPGRAGQRLIDKLPFALVAAPHMHRLFAGTPIIFVERHPCDVVLSCYFNRFVPTGPGASFVDLIDTAKLYDLMMRFWFRSRELLPLRAHSVRYERLVENPETELRQVADFLDLEWSANLVDNRETAHRRGFINTPSYAQVTEPVYKASIARWTRYRKHFQPVLPILESWARRLDYDL